MQKQKLVYTKFQRGTIFEVMTYVLPCNFIHTIFILLKVLNFFFKYIHMQYILSTNPVYIFHLFLLTKCMH